KFRIWLRSPTELSAELDQEPLRALEGARAVAHVVLLIGIELGERAAELWHQEQRVVTEPALSTRGVEDPPLDRPVELGDDLARPRDRDHAAEARGALRLGHRAEVLEQLGPVLSVARAGAGESRRANAGRAAERVDLEAGVVGEDEPA